ncbi:MAG: hypothetical protein GW827_13040 [Flavobacteriales bacterium]|nr:hypothetical protein [Flavobacteriales bacterium]
MLRVNDFRNYITEIKNAIPEITNSETVMDDSQLSKFLQEQASETYIILGVIPKHNLLGTVDSLSSKDRVAILVLKKIVRSDHTHSDFLDTIDEAQQVTKKVIDKILADFADEDNCGFLRYLIPAETDVEPVWALNSCDGYEIDLVFNTTF